MSYDPEDRDELIDHECPLCGHGLLRSIGMEIFCTYCMTAFVEEVISPREVAHRENVRYAHTKR